MNKEELKDKIRAIAIEKYGKIQSVPQIEDYEEFSKFPELKKVIVDLLTTDYNSFVSSIDWVSPKPTMFRINLKNNQYFYLTWNERTWVAQIEGKKYYLLNLPEEQRALGTLSRLLKYGSKEQKEEEGDTSSEEENPLDNMEA